MDWRRVRQRLVLILVLLLVAIVLVVGTQNFDERASVHFLFWSFDTPLLVFFLASVCLGVLASELVRFSRQLLKRPGPPASNRPAAIHRPPTINRPPATNRPRARSRPPR